MNKQPAPQCRKTTIVRNDGVKFPVTIAQATTAERIDSMNVGGARDVVLLKFSADETAMLANADDALWLFVKADDGGFHQGQVWEEGGLWTRKVDSLEEGVADWSA